MANELEKAFINTRICNPSSYPEVYEVLAVKHGIISFLGSKEELDRKFTSIKEKMEKIDLQGLFVLPGFIDTHLHFVTTASQGWSFDLRGCKSLAECQEKILEKAAGKTPDDWLLGLGFNYNQWTYPKRPTWKDLELPEILCRVAIISKDGHLLWVNKKALEAAGINQKTPDPDGGCICRFPEKNEPNGILLEEAMRPVLNNLPEKKDREFLECLKELVSLAWSHGITSVHDCDGYLKQAELREWINAGHFKLRFYNMIPCRFLDQAIRENISTGDGDEWVRTGPLKILADGSLGSQTAALLESYENSEDQGILIWQDQELEAMVKSASLAGISSAIHAIGDRTCRIILDLYEKLANSKFKKNCHIPNRIEHAQMVHPQDQPRFGNLGVVAAVQPIHIAADIDTAQRHWGARSLYAYPFRSLLKSGGILAFGSDYPIEDINPLAGIATSMLRQRLDGTPEEGWFSEQRLSLQEALLAYTEKAAYSSGESHLKGRLEVGKLADFVVLSEDPFQIPAEKINQIEVLMTVIGGEIVWSKL